MRRFCFLVLLPLLAVTPLFSAGAAKTNLSSPQSVRLSSEKAKISRWGIHTNLLSDAILAPSLGVELRTSGRTSMEVVTAWNPIQYAKNRKWKHLLVQPEFRFWTRSAGAGHWVGIHAHWAYFNVGNLPAPLSPYMREHRFEGRALGAGLTYGYRWVLGRHWALEAAAGLGYTNLKYDKFLAAKGGERLERDVRKNVFTPTRLSVNVLYAFGGTLPGTAPKAKPTPRQVRAAQAEAARERTNLSKNAMTNLSKNRPSKGMERLRLEELEGDFGGVAGGVSAGAAGVSADVSSLELETCFLVPGEEDFANGATRAKYSRVSILEDDSRDEWNDPKSGWNDGSNSPNGGSNASNVDWNVPSAAEKFNHLTANLYYSKGAVQIDPMFGRNAKQLLRLNEALAERSNRENGAGNEQANGAGSEPRILVTAYASVEGAAGDNQTLTERRAAEFGARLRAALGSNRGYSAGWNGAAERGFAPEIVTRGAGEDWATLRALVAADPAMPDRAEALRVIDQVSVWGGREKQLMELGGGAAYRRMKERYFPRLRRLVIEVENGKLKIENYADSQGFAGSYDDKFVSNSGDFGATNNDKFVGNSAVWHTSYIDDLEEMENGKWKVENEDDGEFTGADNDKFVRDSEGFEGAGDDKFVDNSEGFKTVGNDKFAGTDNTKFASEKGLTLREWWSLACMYEPDSEEFEHIVKTTAQLYPASDTASLNAAAAALQRGDTRAAAAYLERVRRPSPTYWNHAGVLAWQRGDRATALRALSRGGQVGARNRTAIEKMENGKLKMENSGSRDDKFVSKTKKNGKNRKANKHTKN